MNITENLLADFLTQDEAAAELKVSERTLDRWRRLGEGAPVTKIGRRVLYRRTSLQAWLHAREHHGHGDNGAGEQSSSREKQQNFA
jgi:excisionase family DNA binding protein